MTLGARTDILGSVTSTDRPALRAARRARGWSLADAARELEALARAAGSPGARAASLKSLLSRWENGHAAPDAANRALLARLYERTPAELGLVTEQAAPADHAWRLRGLVAAAATVDRTVLDAWAAQAELVRGLDDEIGAAGAAGAVRALVEDLERTLTHAAASGTRSAVAVLLARAVTLAGWQELDLGDTERAWQRFARAREAATIAAHPAPGVPARPGTGADARAVAHPSPPTSPAEPAAEADEVHAEAVAGQAAVLLALDVPVAALALVDASFPPHVLGGDGSPGPSPVTEGGRAWLAAGRGAALAAAGRAGDALRVYEAAERAFAAEAAHPSPARGPGGRHPIRAADLRRWRGQALAPLGRPDCASTLEAALAAGIGSVRERAATHAALAVALAGQGSGDGAGRAAAHARTARDLAERIGSVRVIAQLTHGGGAAREGDGQAGRSPETAPSGAGARRSGAGGRSWVTS